MPTQPDDHPARGRFIALDGPDGGGKTTQLAALADWLRSEGREVVTCRDPGGTALGDRLRAILLDRATGEIEPRAEMLLYMASRAELVGRVIRPALASGKVVLSDRFVLANVVYQGVAGGLPVAEIWDVARAATGGLLPDLTLVLDLPPALATARVGPARDRIEDRADDYRDRVRSGFLRAAEPGGYPAPIAVVDASAEPEAVAFKLRGEVARALAIDPRS